MHALVLTAYVLLWFVARWQSRWTDCSLRVVAVRSCYAAASMLCCAVLCWGKDVGDSVRLNEVLTDADAGSAHSHAVCNAGDDAVV